MRPAPTANDSLKVCVSKLDAMLASLHPIVALGNFAIRVAPAKQLHPESRSVLQTQTVKVGSAASTAPTFNIPPARPHFPADGLL
jgi:hypothetical protein